MLRVGPDETQGIDGPRQILDAPRLQSLDIASLDAHRLDYVFQRLAESLPSHAQDVANPDMPGVSGGSIVLRVAVGRYSIRKFIRAIFLGVVCIHLSHP